MEIKWIAAFVVAVAVGFACGYFEVPAPAPPTIVGALLVVAMSVGYMAGSKVRGSGKAAAVETPAAGRRES
jgi:hypothetical protein